MREESFRGYDHRDREKNFPGRNRQASLPGMSGAQSMASWFVIRPSPPAVSQVPVCQVQYKILLTLLTIDDSIEVDNS